ncbi:peripheral-type benzodiazepine receptor-associated protein 1 isoform X4 [Oryzias melastigma]|uniref:peripheral-type benzodiazepine receptor-associated protein 1 isoform X4 n=1 Tax=Oryzias melastigma TaxID=30732 RepID=UPI00168CC979|nr:peripheral-type benzodiazepine receptor-associated protein 1 isoform X4 [Oryzias melastigma]
MRDDRDNPLALSFKSSSCNDTDYGRELRRLRADLEAEKNQEAWACGRLAVELRRLREEAEREHQRAVKELAARRGSRKGQNGSRKLLAEELRKEDDERCGKEPTGEETFSFCSIQTQLLLDKINSKEATFKSQDFEIEKAILLCHLLETHGRLLRGTQKNISPRRAAKCSSKKPNYPSAPQVKPPGDSHSSQRSKQEEWRQPVECNPPADASCFSTIAGKTCQSTNLTTGHPHPPPTHAGQENQASNWTESSGSDELSVSKCMGRSMERVMYDLCARSEQPEPADMESSNSVVALGKQQQQLSESEKPDSNKEVPKTAKLATKSLLGKRHHSLYANLSGFEAEGLQKNGTDYGFLVRQNSELLRALDELEKTCSALKEENGLLRKSSAPGTEEKVRRLRKKNTELAVLAKRLEERARKLQEANLRVVNSPSLMRPGSVEHYKRAFARQRARDLAHHADALLSKDKEIAALQQECRELEDQLGHSKGLPLQSSRVEVENLLRESQKEVLRLQRQLSVTSSRQQDDTDLHVKKCGENTKDKGQEKVGGETPCVGLDEAPSRCTKTPTEEGESWLRVTPPSGLSPSPSHQEDPPEEQRIQFLERELNSKRKECEDLEHEVKKRQRRCLDLESQLENERGKNEHLKEEADLLRRKALLLDQSRAENEELREELSEVTAQRNSVLEENQRLRAKLENLEQVLKHMREVAERRQQLELEHEQALAILKFKQDEIKRLQRAQLFAKREHEGVVQMLEELTQLVLRRELSKVRELEEKCRSQSEQFGLLSQELEKFRLQASKVDLASSTLLNNPSLSVLTNGVGLTTERDGTAGSWDEIAFWSVEGGDTLSCPEDFDCLDVAAALRMGATPHPAGLSRVERSPVTKHRELPTISVSKSASSSNKSETAHLTPKSDTHLSPHKSSPTHEVDTASEVEELDIDVAPAPYTASRGAAKLQVFIARYSYNPYDGPNDNPEVELPLTAGEYIYVYGDMDDDGFYEGELMDGRRGLVPSNFVERVSDDDLLSAHHPETGDASHNSLLDSSLHSASHQHHLHSGVGASAPAPPPSDSRTASSVPPPLTNGLDLDLEEVGVDLVPYPRKLTLIKQLAKSIIIGWDPPLVPAGWGNVFSYNVFVDQELRLNVPFGAQTKAVLERLDINLKAYRVSVQSLTEKGVSDQLRCSLLVGRDVCVAPTQLCVDRVTATSANLTWLPSNSNYVHIVSLNDEECELVKAGCYSLCLNNLLPSLQYTVKVEARPHRTPWELPVERREHRSATITFNTLMAGPPDAPLDVQLEQGPSPGIALISWLPVTIDAAGTSNGVRVTGYSIYVDRKKVLEVSSPTAGSALLGPSQIQCLQAAQELTLRTMSAHGESCDSLPVKVPSKLAAIMAGPAVSSPVVPAVPCASLTPSILPPHLSYSAANISASPLPSDTHVHGLTVETAAKTPGALHSDHHPTSASYVMAWANPSAAAALSVCEATLPAPSAITPPVNITPSIISTSPQACPAAAPSPAPAPTAAPAPSLEPHRDADSPGTIRPFPSITDFMEDPSDPKFATPERIPTPPKAPITDLLNPQYSNVLRPPSTSPLESEVEEELENTRLVSIEEFLRQDQDPAYSRRQQSYRGGFEEPPTDYNADNSRSDLSDILEEEEEDLCSDHLVEGQARGYSLGANRPCKLGTPDSEEEMRERILKLPPQVLQNKHLFSIAEVTEEEDSSQEEALAHRSKPRPGHSHLHHGGHHHPPQHHPNPHNPPHHHHFNRDLRSLGLRQEPLQVKPKTQHRVHYAATVAYPEDENSSLYEGPTSRRVSAHPPPKPTPTGKEKSLLRGLGDRLRREAMLRSQMAVSAVVHPDPGPTAPRSYPVSKTVRSVKSPVGRRMEIDVEYGTDTEEPVDYNPGEVVLEQMSSEWWVEEAPVEHCRPSHRRGAKAEPMEPSQIPPAVAGPSWTNQAELSSKVAKQPKGESPKMKGDSDVRIFVALFPYDPATMSPNPDAAEEELPFSEGQIIKVYGDKDADGFYRGESGGHVGFVPCNMVSEIQVEDEETRQQLLQQGFLSTATSMEKIEPCQTAPPTAAGKPVSGARRMIAIFDYDPRESSPNTDIEAELTFSAGDVIHVFGDMDEDGFFYGDLNGHRGLVPSNFLQAFPDEAPAEAACAPPPPEPKKESQVTSTEPQCSGPSSLEETLNLQSEVPHLVKNEPTPSDPATSTSSDPDPPPGPANVAACYSSPAPLPSDSPAPADCSAQAKKKKGFFSKGKKLFRKLGSSKKE